MTGWELVSQMHKIKPDVKVILMTAFDVEQEAESALAHMEWQAVLQKPFSLQEIRDAIKRQLLISTLRCLQ